MMNDAGEPLVQDETALLAIEYERVRPKLVLGAVLSEADWEIVSAMCRATNAHLQGRVDGCRSLKAFRNVNADGEGTESVWNDVKSEQGKETKK
jgi:hypothetical protein